MELNDELSNEFVTRNQYAANILPGSTTARSFEGNITSETFEGVKIEGAIKADQEIIQIQVIDSEYSNSNDIQLTKKVKPPRVPKTAISKAAKKFEIGKRQKDLEDIMLEEPIQEIKLTHEEARVLKNVVFRNYLAELDPVYKKVADKEVNLINKAV